MEPEFQPYGLPHLTVIFLTIVLPFVLAAMVWRTKSQPLEKMITSSSLGGTDPELSRLSDFHPQPRHRRLATDAANANVRLGHGGRNRGDVEWKSALV